MPVSTIYERVTTFHSLGTIYNQGLAFGEAGRLLIESGQSNLFVPGMINICLATEIFLKSINAKMANLEDEVMQPGGYPMYIGRNDDYFKITPGGQGHDLSKIFTKLPDDAKTSIAKLAREQGYSGDIAAGLAKYDTVFVEWRYIYEKKDPGVLGTHPLVQICNAVEEYCRSVANSVREVVADPIASSHPAYGSTAK